MNQRAKARIIKEPDTRTATLLVVTIVLLSNFLVCGMVYIALSQSHQKHEERAKVASQNIAKLLQQVIGEKIEKTELALFSLRDSIERQMREGGINKAFLNARTMTVHSRLEGLDGIRITNAKGIVTYGVNVPDDSNVSIAEDDHFPFLKAHPDAGTLISKPKFGKISKKWVIKVVLRYNHPDGRFAGLISGIIDLQYFADQFSRIEVSPHDVIVLRDSDMNMIVRYPNQDENETVVGLKNLPESFREMYRKQPVSGTLTVSSAFDGVHRTISYHKVGKWPLLVHVGLATDDYLMPWRDDLRNYALVAGLFAVFSLFMTFMILRVWRLRNASEKALKQTQFAFDHSADPIFWADAAGRIRNVNAAACKKLGYTRDELLGLSIPDIDNNHHAQMYTEFLSKLENTKSITFETVHRTKHGELIPVEVTANLLEFEGEIMNCGFARDITERKRLQKELELLATTDELTGLPNRRSFMEFANNEYRRAQRYQQPLTIALIDIDHFKDVNDTYGHAVGDQVLQSLSTVFRNSTREIDLFARLGGDEFALLLPGANAEQAYEIVERARSALMQSPIPFNHAAITINISAGIASMMDPESLDILMSKADQALYQSKQSGRNRVTILKS